MPSLRWLIAWWLVGAFAGPLAGKRREFAIAQPLEVDSNIERGSTQSGSHEFERDSDVTRCGAMARAGDLHAVTQSFR
jgi:hypothetical protein